MSLLRVPSSSPAPRRPPVRPLRHPRRALGLLALIPLLLATGGCVSQSDHEALQAELAACRQEKAQVEAEVISWEQRYDRESARWNQIGASVSEMVPKALSEMHGERERILNLVPDQVQTEVSSYLDEYFNTVMTGFDRMSRDNQDLQVQVLGLQKAMDVLGHDTKAIGQAIDESLTDEKGRRERVAQDLADIIDLIVEYDQTRLNCKGCDERLRMRDKSRSDVLAFHQELMSDLSRLQTFAASPGGDMPAEPPSDDDAEAEAAEAEAAGGAEAPSEEDDPPSEG